MKVVVALFACAALAGCAGMQRMTEYGSGLADAKVQVDGLQIALTLQKTADRILGFAQVPRERDLGAAGVGEALADLDGLHAGEFRENRDTGILRFSANHPRHLSR